MSSDVSGTPALRRTISFEVAVRRQRRWEVHATYPAYERETALEDAKALEKEPQVDGTKVTKETWRHDTNRVDTAVIYRSRALEEEMIELAAARPKPPPPRRVGFGPRLMARVTGADLGDRTADTSPNPGAEKIVTEVSMAQAAPWIMVAFIVACMVGAGAAVLASMAVQAAIEDGMSLSRQEQSGILIAAFLTATGLTFLIALRRIVARFARDRRLRREAAAKAGRDLAQSASSDVPGDRTDSEPSAPEVPPPASAEPDNEGEGRRGVVLSSNDVAEKVPDADRFGTQIQAFETALRDRLSERLDRFDASQRFALNIYIAGAIERLAQLANIDGMNRQKLLMAPLIRLGTAPDIAARFGQTLDEYLTRPRALDVFNRGREAAARFADDDADAIDPLSAIAAWDMPVADGGETESDIIAIMFTDIVDSTARSYEFGDQAGQMVVRTHNAIVRDVLQRCDGVEIKHTGDGIMASFAVASHAVEAARLIHRNTEAFCAADKRVAFELRVGINVGEPIRENDDLFGAAVQLASRLCGAGSAGQTIVSRIVRDLCVGKDYVFDSLGSVELKGIPGETELFALRWRDAETALPLPVAATG